MRRWAKTVRPAPHGGDELRRVVTDTLLEDERHIADVFDPPRRIAVDHDDVRLLASCNRSDERTAAKERGAIQRTDPDRLERR